MGADMKFCLMLTAALVCLLAHGAFACSMCADNGTIEKRETCSVCKGSGKTANTKTEMCSACNGTGKKTFSKREGGRYQGTFCRQCSGSGHRSSTTYEPCGACGGKGVIITRVPCPMCKGAAAINSADRTLGVSANGGGTSVAAKVDVLTCTHCDEKGRVSHKVACEICDHGWNHRKNDSGSYVCRLCGAVCESRFSPCKCGKPDCPICKGDYEKTVFQVCPYCNGDKIITPLEQEKMQKESNK